MKILLINHYAGSIYHGMEFRPYYLSKEWVKMGHEVVIVAASFSHLRQKNIEMTAEIKEENIDGIRYIWLKTPEYNGNGFGRIRNMLTFIRKLYSYLPKITADFIPDAVIASSTYPLDSYPARWIAQKHGAKFVFELHDLWPMSPQVLGKMSKWHPFIMLMQMAEDYWCKNADVVISLLPDAHKHLVTRGMQMEKYFVIPNGVDLNEWTGEVEDIPETHKIFINQLKHEDKFLIAYTGGLVTSNTLHIIIDIADKLRHNSSIYFLLIGKGPDQSRLEEKIAKLKLNNISILPPVPKKAVPSLFKKIDLFVRFSIAKELEQYGSSPNKIFDYMMSAKPVLWTYSAKDNWIDNAGCGFTFHEYDLDEVSGKIQEIYCMDKERLSEMGKKGRDYIINNATYPILAEKFIKALGGDSK
ncbi:glycosyltransferase family 4 protein [Cloacibacillus evryensis]|uniref:glycosyltransferase family 4 protein n=1 Tax=Cloacibacillus evryensis TaxID=508460 RepID=UPI00210AB638|nr:glycosyltransferase family 4 protein [Cloacibacillus evryensis]MCQ4764482.1 glycosyltransferase family 4 protein [Cloacibacillus evryensis]